ncbi:MAG: ABC transporter ATP-binding protein [Parasporobacterium sp.]|nr:ABC transporter ATP-binding protein [Parasporobacterium sp.]
MLKVIDIAKKYRRVPVLNKICFEASPGECLGLVGRNGCGKSTLLQILAGVMRPDSGIISWKEENLFENRQRFSSLIGYVPQENPLFNDATALDHLKLWYSGLPYDLKEDLSNGFPARLHVEEFLNKRVGALSGGMKKRLSLCCALSKRPPVVLMDEPAAALDLSGKKEIRDFISQLKESGTIVIIATHEEADFPLCDALLVFENGMVNRLPSDTSLELLIK